MRSAIVLLSVLSAAGCKIDNTPQVIPPDKDEGPILDAPARVYFDALSEGEEASQVITVENVGTATLQVSSMQIESSSAFSVEFLQAEFLEPDETLDVAVTFSPLNLEDRGWLVIDSTDGLNPETRVELVGASMVPVLEMDPDPVDFGSVAVCELDKETVTLTNIGGADLIIDSLTTAGDRFELLTELELPLTLAPKESRQVELRFSPLTANEFDGELWATTNEALGASSAYLEGVGGKSSQVEGFDTFRQPDGPWDATDVLFYVDRSLSMENNLTNLENNIGQFFSYLAGIEGGYQVMVVTADNGCREAEIITAETEDAETKFKDGTRGNHGDDTEKGLQIARNALTQTGAGQCNDGFIREDAKTMAVLISDEPDQSEENYSSLVSQMQAVAPNMSIIGIAGDLPLGCGLTADPGTGYYEAAMLTEGHFLSICADDWGEHLQVIADLAIGEPTGTFDLSYLPEASTIEVTVNGVVSSSWSYDEVDNAVVFPKGAWPDAGAWIEVEYDLPSECLETED